MWLVPIPPGNRGRHLRATACDPALHSADRHVEDFGNLGVVEVGNIAQDHGYPKVLWQVSERGIEFETVGHMVDAQIAVGVDRLRPVVAALTISTCELWAAAAATQFVEAGIGRDAVHPGSEGGTPVETSESAHDGDHRFLSSVGSIGIVTGDTATDRVHTVVVATQQLIESSAITSLRCGHQRLVVEWCSDVTRLAVLGDVHLLNAAAVIVVAGAASVVAELVERDQHVARRGSE